MRKDFFKRSLLFSIVVLALAALACSPALAQDSVSLKIEVKPCFQCPNGVTESNGAFVCPDNADGSSGWIPCGIPAINLCSQGRTAVAILDFAESGIDPATMVVKFEGATAIRCSRGDVDHDVVEGGQPDDLVCHFYTRELTGLQAQADRNRSQVSATLQVMQDETTVFGSGSDDVVIFKRGSCKGL